MQALNERHSTNSVTNTGASKHMGAAAPAQWSTIAQKKEKTAYIITAESDSRHFIGLTCCVSQ